MQTSSAAACWAVKPAQHTVQVQTDRRRLECRARFGTRKLSWVICPWKILPYTIVKVPLLSQIKLSAISNATSLTRNILNATSLTRNIRRQRRQHSPILQVRCYAITGDQHESIATQFEEICKEVPKKLGAFYQFCRPHTIFGTIIGITSVSLLPMRSLDDFTMKALWGFLEALFSALCMNVYVVGLYQLYDIQIYRVNKPSLPLASGEFSVTTGAVLVLTSLIMSIAIGIRSKSAPLIYALLISFFLGSAYSVDAPLLRWKRNAFLAVSCMLFVRAVLVQLAFFAHMQQHVLKRPMAPTKSVVFATLFMCCFSEVIALFKDIPDIDGDRHFGVESLSVRLGPERVYWLCINIQLTAYGAAILAGASSTKLYQMIITKYFAVSLIIHVFGHCLLAFALWRRAQHCDVENKARITSFYMFIWKLFYAEYFLIPLVQ